MEEQMRWWAECTAQWRHRWSTVRHERNNAREESSAMRAKILQVQTVVEDLENEKRDLKKQLMDAKRELHKINVINLTREERMIKIEEKAEKEAQTEEFQENVGGNDMSKDLETIVTQLKAQLEEERRLRISEKQEKVQLEAEVKKLNDDVSSLQILLDKIDEEKDMDKLANVRAFGEGLAGGQFDRQKFFKKPTVLFRCGGFILGALLWYSISKGGWYKPDGRVLQQVCIYGSSASTCSFASAMGFFAVIGAGILLVLDAKLDQISSIPSRKKAVMADLAVSAAFTGLFLISFFTFWSKYSSWEPPEDEEVETKYAKLGIFLAFLSFLAWGGAAFFAWRRYEEGVATAFASDFDNEFHGTAVPSDHQDGYGYGGSSEGVGAVDGTTGGQMSYQSGGPAMGMGTQMGGGTNMGAQQPQMGTGAPSNPFVSDGYGY
ncbi:hypothetical protein WR25_00125 [Diploscapter pachys]|uniref:MARVEL domain-containing protein n=1 Tax=Diploscapter pachys TaxID=2018661 RepID=A0A2A2KSW9_9BILA|nr:hypothetical protein WR25_00125 [Diploscapter pachys]